MSTAIAIDKLCKDFGETRAVDHVDVNINPGELFFLLGPSGCGKTTLLRMIAGFTIPTAGSIRFNDRNVTNLPPNKRNCGMVFQSYALWPHMSVAQNVAFGLKTRKTPKDEREQRVKDALKAVQMTHLAERKPAQLSGGQQQRVALARALVIKPGVLLLDEPLSNLDAKLRLEMRSEIRRLCRDLALTTLYVTHDQEESLSMADRIALLRDGRVEQIGPPRELYENPSSAFVAHFLGETNFISGEIDARNDGVVTIASAAGKLLARPRQSAAASVPDRGKILCSIRPESLRFARPDDEENLLPGRVIDTMYLGDSAQHEIEIEGKIRIKLAELGPSVARPGEPVKIAVDPSEVVLLPPETTNF